MKLVRAPEEATTEAWPSVFLAGGITGCPEWQKDLAELLARHDDEYTDHLYVLDPRRDNFPMDDPLAARSQIEWEHRHLHFATLVSFWFPAATLCPITLYELGAWSMTDKPIVVGIEPGYAREPDVRIQTSLARPNVQIVDSIDKLATQIVTAIPGADYWDDAE